jgi:hypothetical protein
LDKANSLMSESVQDQLSRTRDLARRARRFAESLTSEADRVRLLRHAAELDAQADDLARTFAPASSLPSFVGRQVQPQRQQQQQAAAPQADRPGHRAVRHE